MWLKSWAFTSDCGVSKAYANSARCHVCVVRSKKYCLQLFRPPMVNLKLGPSQNHETTDVGRSPRLAASQCRGCVTASASKASPHVTSTERGLGMRGDVHNPWGRKEPLKKGFMVHTLLGIIVALGI